MLILRIYNHFNKNDSLFNFIWFWLYFIIWSIFIDFCLFVRFFSLGSKVNRDVNWSLIHCQCTSNENMHNFWSFFHPIQILWPAPVQASSSQRIMAYCYGNWIIEKKKTKVNYYHQCLVIRWPFILTSHNFINFKHTKRTKKTPPPIPDQSKETRKTNKNQILLLTELI